MMVKKWSSSKLEFQEKFNKINIRKILAKKKEVLLHYIWYIYIWICVKAKYAGIALNHQIINKQSSKYITFIKFVFELGYGWNSRICSHWYSFLFLKCLLVYNNI